LTIFIIDLYTLNSLIVLSDPDPTKSVSGSGFKVSGFPIV